MYLSIDIDVLDPAFAPGTGTPEIAGMSTREMVNVIRGLSGLKLISADVVEVSPNTEPPVCKILDYGKYLFEQKKKTQGAKKKQKTIQVKEIKFRPLIEKGDYEVKVNKIRDFIEQGNKVKISLRYRGREMRHVELGHDLLKRVLTDIEGISSVEQEVQFEGRQLITVVAPKHN